MNLIKTNKNNQIQITLNAHDIYMYILLTRDIKIFLSFNWLTTSEQTEKEKKNIFRFSFRFL